MALINTLHRFSESLAAVNDFRKLWAAADAQEEERMIEVAASAVAGSPRVRLFSHLVPSLARDKGADVSYFPRVLTGTPLARCRAGRRTGEVCR